jgi:hypothetical protein
MNIFQPQAWFAKIEVTTDLSDPLQSTRVLSDFLTYALPEIEKCFPSGAAGDAANASSPLSRRN